MMTVNCVRRNQGPGEKNSASAKNILARLSPPPLFGPLGQRPPGRAWARTHVRFVLHPDLTPTSPRPHPDLTPTSRLQRRKPLTCDVTALQHDNVNSNVVSKVVRKVRSGVRCMRVPSTAGKATRQGRQRRLCFLGYPAGTRGARTGLQQPRPASLPYPGENGAQRTAVTAQTRAHSKETPCRLTGGLWSAG